MTSVKTVDLGLPSIRTSERSTFKRCPQKWKWAWRDGLAPNRVATPLWFGTGIHKALAEWYLPGFERGPDPRITWDAFCEEESRMVKLDFAEDESEYVAAVELGDLMLAGYLDKYGSDPHWDVISTEQTFKYLISSLDSKPVPLADYFGTFDGVYRDTQTGEIFLMEHKTSKGWGNLEKLVMDDQASAYWLVATKVLRDQGLIGKREAIDGIMYNMLRKHLPDKRPVNEEGMFLNKDGTVSKQQGTPLFHREPIWRSAGERRGIYEGLVAETRAMAMFRDGDLQVYKNPKEECSWDCEFYRMCQLHTAQEDWEFYRDETYHIRDPYADHRANRKSS